MYLLSAYKNTKIKKEGLGMASLFKIDGIE